jgi:uncharacterized protein
MYLGKKNGRFSAVILGLTLALSALPAGAQSPMPMATPRTLVMSGQGEAKAAPDTAGISAGVTTQGKTAADALAANTRAMNGVFAALKRMGIPDRAIQTSNFSVQPQYPPYNPNGQQEARRIIGYEVSNQVNVRLEDISKLGAALDALVTGGANTMGGINFFIRDDQALLAEARKDAVADALTKAKTYAATAGVTLGRILSISENGGEAPRPLFLAQAKASADSVPVAAGESTVSAGVSITWEIQ